MRAANLGLRFLLELGALAAVGYWGWETGEGLLGLRLAAAAVGAVIAVWALFVSPKHMPGRRCTRRAIPRLH